MEAPPKKQSGLSAKEEFAFSGGEASESFSVKHAALWDLTQKMQSRLVELENEALEPEVAELEVLPRVELDLRVRTAQNLVTKLAKEEQEQLARGAVLKILDQE